MGSCIPKTRPETGQEGEESQKIMMTTTKASVNIVHVQTHSSIYRRCFHLRCGLLGNPAQLQGEGIQKAASPSLVRQGAGETLASALHSRRQLSVEVSQ